MEQKTTPFALITDDDCAINHYELKSKMMIAIRDQISRKGWNQPTAAKHLAVTQPRISSLLGGQIDLFSLDTLVKMLFKLGVRVDFNYEPIQDASTTDVVSLGVS